MTSLHILHFTIIMIVIFVPIAWCVLILCFIRRNWMNDARMLQWFLFLFYLCVCVDVYIDAWNIESILLTSRIEFLCWEIDIFKFFLVIVYLMKHDKANQIEFETYKVLQSCRWVHWFCCLQLFIPSTFLKIWFWKRIERIHLHHAQGFTSQARGP